MKIIYLNVWFGKLTEPLLKFIHEQAPTTDAFCFSEVSNGSREVGGVREEDGLPNLFARIEEALPEFAGKFEGSGVMALGGGEKSPIGLTTFVKKNIEVREWGVASINENADNDDPEEYERILQYVHVARNGVSLWINNTHGLARPGEKLDTPNRITQSHNILNAMAKQEGVKILGGDFNLELNTESVKMFEKAGYKNLVREYNIASTRSDLNREKYPKESWQYYADYTFTSPDINVRTFEVPNLNISDHLPLIVEIE